MNQFILSLILGFLLGLKHAFDIDHLIAISTLVSEYKNPFKAATIGVYWGLGHTFTLFIAGSLILLLKITIPTAVSLSFELLVGLMLIILGIKVLLSNKNIIHQHQHQHQKINHQHLHMSFDLNHRHSHQKSFLIGTIHGLAGTASLMILLLATIKEIYEGMIYILIFGIGSIMAMTLMSIVFGLPLIFSTKKFPQIEAILKFLVGVLSIIFGLTIIYEIGLVRRLFLPF